MSTFAGTGRRTIADFGAVYILCLNISLNAEIMSAERAVMMRVGPGVFLLLNRNYIDGIKQVDKFRAL